MKKDLRKAVIAGNWKMNKTPAEAKALIEEMKPLVAGADCDVVLCVPFIDIPAAIEAAAGSNIKIGAENVHFVALFLSKIAMHSRHAKFLLLEQICNFLALYL